VVLDIKRVSIPEVLVSLVLLAVPQEELAEFEHHLRLALVQCGQLQHVVLCLGPVTIQLLVFLGQTLVSLGQVLLAVTGLKGNQAVSLAGELLLRDCHVFVQFVLFSLDNFLDGKSHLLDKVSIELRVEVVSLIFIQALHSLRVLLVEVLLHNAYNGFLHLFFHDVVLTRGVDFIKEFLLAFLKSLSSLLL
jgi:hypothetical protein